MPESGRIVIKEQLAAGGNALPWADRVGFAERMFRLDRQAWHAAHQLAGTVFFDRGLPDVAGYLKLIGERVPPHIEYAALNFRYHRRVFIAPPWPAIFVQDAERKQSLDEAQATYRVMVDIYTDLGYQLEPLPVVSVAERVKFIRAAMGD